MVELLRHWGVSKETGSQTDGWLIHAACARCGFGSKTHYINEVTRERYEHRYYGDDVASYSFSNEDRYSTHGLVNVVSEEDQLEEAEKS